MTQPRATRPALPPGPPRLPAARSYDRPSDPGQHASCAHHHEPAGGVEPQPPEAGEAAAPALADEMNHQADRAHGLTRERVRQIEVEALKRLATLHEMEAVAFTS